MNLPVDFEQLVRGARGATSADYPYAIKATDLMKNFTYAGLDLDNSLFDVISGQGGHLKRKLKIPPIPQAGTYVLGAVDGAFAWIETQSCA